MSRVRSVMQYIAFLLLSVIGLWYKENGGGGGLRGPPEANETKTSQG